MKNFGIRTQILLTVVGVVVGSFALIYILVTPLLRGALVEERAAHTQWLAQVLATELTLVCENRDDAARHVHTWVRSLETSACLALVGGDGEFVGDAQQGLAACVESRQVATVRRTKIGQSQTLGSAAKAVLVVAAAIPPSLLADRLGSDARLLYVTPLAGIEARAAASNNLLILFMLLGVGLVTLMGFAVLTQLIVRPTSRLVRTVDRVTAGDLEAQAELSGGEEIQALGQAFNNLTQKLREDEARIGRQLNELRYINDQLERATDSLLRSEKMASVGKLAAGVAHEIGNPVSIVLGYLEMLKRPDATDEERVEWLTQTGDAIQRVDAIIRDLLDFSRMAPQEEDARANVGDVVRGTLQLLQPQQSLSRVTVEKAVPDEPVFGAIAETRLQQVLINLVMNAADAMANQPQPTLKISVEVTDERIKVQVADNGAGIGPADRRRLFDPFFTTKEPGSGTGLGLSICYSIMQACGGEIRCESALGEGSQFTLDIPLCPSN